MPEPDGRPPLDLTLLRGFRYACRPDCGLCCYAEPRVEPEERPRLLKIAPLADIASHHGGSFLRARPDGGACQFLTERRCAAWSVRPSPCQQFPLTVHVGERLQATLVLSCPGIDLESLTQPDAWAARPAPEGLEREISAVERRVTPAVRRPREEALRRRRRVVTMLETSDQWVDEELVREALREALPLPTAEEFPVADPPAGDDDLANLPLFFDHRKGPVAIAGGLGGWELLELSAEGGGELRALVPPPSRPPELAADGRRLLEGYLRYFLERDALFGTVVPQIEPGGNETVAEALERELRTIGALVVEPGRRASAGVPGRRRLAHRRGCGGRDPGQ